MVSIAELRAGSERPIGQFRAAVSFRCNPLTQENILRRVVKRDRFREDQGMPLNAIVKAVCAIHVSDPQM